MFMQEALKISYEEGLVYNGEIIPLVDLEKNDIFAVEKYEEVTTKTLYYEVQPFSEGLAAFCIKGLKGYRRHSLWGFINTFGEVVIEPQFQEVKPFSEGLAAVKIDVATPPYTNEKWGFIDTEGNYVIELQYGKVDSFSDGIAKVSKDTYRSSETYININNETVKDIMVHSKSKYVAERYRSTRALAAFSRDMCLAPEDEANNVIKQLDTVIEKIEGTETKALTISNVQLANTTIAIPDVFNQYEAHEGWRKFQLNGKWGFINFESVPAKTINPNFDGVKDFKNGYAAVKKGKLWGVIDTTGNIVISIDYQEAPENIGQLFIASKQIYKPPKRSGETGKNETLYGIINLNEEIILPIEYENISSFKEGYAIARKEYGISNFINERGELIIGHKVVNPDEKSSSNFFVVKGLNINFINPAKKFGINYQVFDSIYPYKWFDTEEERDNFVKKLNTYISKAFEITPPPNVKKLQLTAKPKSEYDEF